MTPNKTAPILITGAGRRIGAHLARRLLEAGQPVLAHYRNKTDAVEQLRAAGADTIATDFADSAGIQAFAKAVRERYPRLRGIIHNASGFGPTVDTQEGAARQFQGYFTVHMLTPFLLNRALGPCLQGHADAGGRADIIHITDIYADDPAPEYDIYCATKAGLQSLAISAAKQLAPKVKVNILQPGPIEFAEWHEPEQQKQILDQTLLKRSGGAEAIYQAVHSLLENNFMTGAVIAVDGGSRWR